jgi:hypothetical protein
MITTMISLKFISNGGNVNVEKSNNKRRKQRKVFNKFLNKDEFYKVTEKL